MKINWFQVGIAVLQAGGAVVALHQGQSKLAALMGCYVVASFILAIM